MLLHDEGHGYDVFGMHPPAVRRALRWLSPAYHRYFRVRSHGHANIPASGPAILVSNHGGILPVDAAMLWCDVALHTERVLRPVADRFVPLLPIISTLFARGGVVSGTRANVRHLLEQGELIAIFPEGTTGPAKPARERYKLQDWRVGHVELALRYHAPIIPVAIVGAEESWPMLARLNLPLFGAPYLPIPRSPLPLPVPFELWYGRPIELHAGLARSAADDPALVATNAARTRAAVEALLERGLASRRPS